MPPPPYPIIATTGSRRPRYLLLVLGGLALAGAGAAAGVAAGLMLRPAGALPDAGAVQRTVQEGVQLAQQALSPTPSTAGAPTTPLITRPATVCASCGTVEGVRALPRGTAAAGGGAAFEVQVRMDDGTLRSFTSATQPQPGVAVRVQGEAYRVLPPPGAETPRTARSNG